MAELMVLHYHPGCTVLHGLDARIKVVGLAALSVASLNAEFGGLVLASTITVVAGYPLRRMLLRFFVQMKVFLLLLFGIWLARALTTPGEPLFSVFFFHLSRPGIIAGLIVCWRLVFMVILSLLLVATTPVDHIRAAIQWWLRPIPFLSRPIIGDMIQLMIRFIPVLFICSQRISDAQLSRGIECRRHPLYRIRTFSLAWLRQCFLTADQLAKAMAARCYNPHRALPAWPLRGRDWFGLAGVGLLCLALAIV